MPLAEFERMNEENLAANKKAYEELAAHVKNEPVREADFFATATRMMKDARDFVVSHHVVTLATDDAAVGARDAALRAVELGVDRDERPLRDGAERVLPADHPGPDVAREGSRRRTSASMGDLLGTTIHEVYPGHFVQGRWAERAPTRVQKAFGNYAFVEGWAHYTEQMMIDEGFGKDDPANRLAQLHGALLRNCRFAASVGIHTQGMTVEQAERRFVDDCHQSRSEAHEQAMRGTFDPGYFAYTLGKMQILALREEAKKQLGAALLAPALPRRAPRARRSARRPRARSRAARISPRRAERRSHRVRGSPRRAPRGRRRSRRRPRRARSRRRRRRPGSGRRW